MHLLLKDCSLLLPYTYKTLSFCFIGSLSPSTFSPLLLLGDHFIFFLNSPHKTFEIEILFSICTFFFGNIIIRVPGVFPRSKQCKIPRKYKSITLHGGSTAWIFFPILNIFIKLEISFFFFEFHLVVFGNVFF